MAQSKTQVRVLLRLFDEAYDRKSWHGPNLRGSLRGISARQAIWRPGQKRHSIWELALHATYWKYAVRRRLRNEKRGSFPIKGSDWFTRSARAEEQAWRADLRLLDATHRALREAVADLSDRDLRRKPAGGAVSVEDLVIGIAAHDLYHAGQIQLIKRINKKLSRR